MEPPSALPWHGPPVALGPLPLVGNKGTLTARDKEFIQLVYFCSANVRTRSREGHSTRMLAVIGPAGLVHAGWQAALKLVALNGEGGRRSDVRHCGGSVSESAQLVWTRWIHIEPAYVGQRVESAPGCTSSEP
ncbi:unnamed protein product, partial [Prorocentrum cordatum]